MRSSDARGSLRTLEKKANNLSRFLLSRGLSVSPAFIVFSRKRISPLNFVITLDGITVNSSRWHRFLEVLLDYSLRGQEHARYLAENCGKLAIMFWRHWLGFDGERTRGLYLVYLGPWYADQLSMELSSSLHTMGDWWSSWKDPNVGPCVTVCRFKTYNPDQCDLRWNWNRSHQVSFYTFDNKIYSQIFCSQRQYTYRKT